MYVCWVFAPASSTAKLINFILTLDAGVTLKFFYPSICVPVSLTCTQPHPLPQPVVLQVA